MKSLFTQKEFQPQFIIDIEKSELLINAGKYTEWSKIRKKVQKIRDIHEYKSAKKYNMTGQCIVCLEG